MVDEIPRYLKQVIMYGEVLLVSLRWLEMGYLVIYLKLYVRC